MDNQNQPVIKKNYRTFKEAFNALPEPTKAHCIRVAEYTRALFLDAVAIEFRLGDDKASEQLEAEHERGAYLCGLYHDIGKVLIPVQYHNPLEDFGTEETALYRKHPADGAALGRQMVFGEELTDIEKDMIAEAIEFHHERPSSVGFEDGKNEADILPMALITGFASHFDHLVTARRSETPFEDVMKEVLARFSEETELQFLLQEGQNRLRRVFLKYQEQSLMIPNILPFVKRKNNRSFELKYRPIVDRKTKATVAVQAKPYFKDNKDTFVDYEEVKTILNKNKLIPEVGRYFIYEAGDMTKRIAACELPIQYVALELMPSYFTQTKIVQVMQQQLSDARMENGKLLFAIDESLFRTGSKAFISNMERMAAAGMPVLLTGWTGAMSLEDIRKYGIVKAALGTDIYPRLSEPETEAAIKALQEAGIEVIAGDMEKVKYSGLLTNLEVMTMAGPMAGDFITEDELVLGELKLLLQK